MRLSFIFELLLIFVLIAFAASRVIDKSTIQRPSSVVRKSHHHNTRLSAQKLRQEATNAANKYCTCNAKLCNCCREFNIPVVSLQGPGCAALQYLRGDKLSISMSFGDRILTNTTIDSKKPKPVCMPLPGGVSKFCGRVYNIARQGEDFNACLGLELRAVKDVEAALRVSCFKFGPKGLKIAEAQPLPVLQQSAGNAEDEDDDDDDDDDDEFDFDDVDDIDDDDDDDDDEEDDDGDNAVDYETFSVFDDDFIGTLFAGEEGNSENKKKKVVSTTKAPLPLKKTPTRKTIVVQKKPAAPATTTVGVAGTTPSTQVDTKKTATKTTTVQPPTPTTVQPPTPTTARQIPKRKTTMVIRRTIPPSSVAATAKTPASVVISSEVNNVVEAFTNTPTVVEIPKITEPQVVVITPTTTTKKTYITRKTKRPSTSTTITTTTQPSEIIVPETTAFTATTTESVNLITSATIVTSEKKPVLDNNDQVLPEKTIASNEIITPPHESIAAVAAMLQNIPAEQEPLEASKVVPAQSSTEKVQFVTFNYVPLKLVEASSTVTVQDAVQNEETDSELTEGTTVQEVTEEFTTPSITDEDDEEDDTILQNFIIKNDEEDNEVTTENIVIPTTEKISTAEKQKTSVFSNSEKVDKLKDKPESKDVLTDIIDGVVNTFTDDSGEEKNGKKPVNNDKDDDDDDDDDDDFLEDDDDDDDDDDNNDDDDDNDKEDDEKDTEKKENKTEEDDVEESEEESNVKHDDEDDEDDEDDDDNDFVARKTKQHKKTGSQRIGRGRQSRDMWLDRLHW